jgi:hypothetical protein
MNFNGWIINYDDIHLKKNNGRTEFKWDIKFSDNIMEPDEIYPYDQHKKVYNTIDSLTQVMGLYTMDDFSDIRNALTKAGHRVINSLYSNEKMVNKIHEMYKKKGVIWDDKGNFSIKKRKSVLSYVFDGTLSIRTYLCVRDLGQEKDNMHIQIISRNHKTIDGVNYYAKYDQLNKNISFDHLLFTYNSHTSQGTHNYIQTHEIKSTTISAPLDNNNLKQYMNNKETNDIVIIDLIISIKKQLYLRTNYVFHTSFSALIIALDSLKQGGSIIYYIPSISNKMILNFLVYLGQYFDDAYIYTKNETSYLLCISVYVFKGYKGGIDINKFLELNNKLYEHDPTGGFEYGTKATKYLSNIVTPINVGAIDELYSKMLEYSTMQFKLLYERYISLYHHYTKKDDIEYVMKVFNTTYSNAILFAQKNKLPLADWVNNIPIDYFNSYIQNVYLKMDAIYIKKINVKQEKISVGLHTNITIPKKDIHNAYLYGKEKLYTYTANMETAKEAQSELYFNYNYKKLNKQIKDKGITINGRYVSRAWTKMYELLSETKILNNINGTIRAFFICEAPGNFINSMMHYVKTNTKISNFEWTAQSYSDKKSNVFDTYGFIEKTKEQWDFGPTTTGDIADIDNFRHYIQTYKGADILIGDCGTDWGKGPNTSLFQCLYALLIPKVSGNFIIKLFIPVNNDISLAFIYLLSELYEDMFFFKSNTNFWSTEMYLVGQNKLRDITSEEIDNIYKIIDQHDGQNVLYPVSKIPQSFMDEYLHGIADLIHIFTRSKMFFYFLTYNNELFNSNKEKIQKIIDGKINKWLNKYTI